MSGANASEENLREKGEISTDFGEIISWKYLCFVRENPIVWNVPTEILYAGNDNLISRQTVDRFMSSQNANLTVMENGEHSKKNHGTMEIYCLNMRLSRKECKLFPKELYDLVQGGESYIVEFKKSTTDITKDVYDSVCAFSNREEDTFSLE